MCERCDPNKTTLILRQDSESVQISQVAIRYRLICSRIVLKHTDVSRHSSLYSSFSTLLYITPSTITSFRSFPVIFSFIIILFRVSFRGKLPPVFAPAPRQNARASDSRSAPYGASIVTTSKTRVKTKAEICATYFITPNSDPIYSRFRVPIGTESASLTARQKQGRNGNTTQHKPSENTRQTNEHKQKSTENYDKILASLYTTALLEKQRPSRRQATTCHVRTSDAPSF